MQDWFFFKGPLLLVTRFWIAARWTTFAKGFLVVWPMVLKGRHLQYYVSIFIYLFKNNSPFQMQYCYELAYKWCKTVLPFPDVFMCGKTEWLHKRQKSYYVDTQATAAPFGIRHTCRIWSIKAALQMHCFTDILDWIGWGKLVSRQQCLLNRL